MDKICEFYENMKEIVYVSDIKTHELIYMNRMTRDMFHIHSMEELKGKKCYEVLQDSNEPCAFCNNRNLKHGEYDEQVYYNPLYNKTFSLKDTLVEVNGRTCRLELAVNMSIGDQKIPTFRTHADHEILINEGLRQVLAVSSPSKSLDILMEYLGRELRGDRVYIFEEDQGKGYSNTYEWCADGVVPQKDNLQQVSPEIASIWLEQFRNKENVIIKQLDDIRETDPRMYDLLKPQDIHSLVASSLVFNNRIIGFYGIDNPPAELMENISVLFQIMGYFIVSLMRRRILQDRLEKLSFYDPLTGCRNRHAMNDFMETIEKNTSVGLLYGDVIGLKRVNDAKGHQAGDALLVRAADSMRQVFSDDDLYRVGGDEFLVMCTGIAEEELLSKEKQLKQALREHQVEMSLGRVWSLKGDLDMDDLLRRADELMYEDKRRYYAQDAARRRAGQTTTE